MSGGRKRKLKSKFRFVMFLLLLAGIFVGGFAAANNLLWPLITGEPLVDTTDDEAEKFAKMPGINVLLMGVDERSDETSLRTDTMILANVNNKENRVALLSIPRDTKVNLPGHGVNKINAANIYGGPELAMEKVSELTGVSVDYYVTTNFNGFEGIVDALGGVTVDVEKDMNYGERAYGGAYDIHLKKGVQKLDGEKALEYARFRHDELGDITRTQRQLKLLTAIGNEAMQPGTITKLHKLVPQIYKNVDTNLGLAEMVALAKAAKNLDNVQIVTQTMPGWFLNENGVSYWYVDPDGAQQVATALFEEGKVVDVVQGEINNGPNRQVAMENNNPSPAAGAVSQDLPDENIEQDTSVDQVPAEDTVVNKPDVLEPDMVDPGVADPDAGAYNSYTEPNTNYPTDETVPRKETDHVEVIIQP